MKEYILKQFKRDENSFTENYDRRRKERVEKKLGRKLTEKEWIEYKQLLTPRNKSIW